MLTNKADIHMRNRGFTLIELMIVVAIVGILAAVAYPSYVSQTQKSRRADAKTALITGAQQMERYFTQNNTYVGATAGATAADTVPATTSNGYYAITLGGLGAAAYTLTATPGAAQASDPCGTLTYNETGTKTVSGSTVAYCW